MSEDVKWNEMESVNGEVPLWSFLAGVDFSLNLVRKLFTCQFVNGLLDNYFDHLHCSQCILFQNYKTKTKTKKEKIIIFSLAFGFRESTTRKIEIFSRKPLLFPQPTFHSSLLSSLSSLLRCCRSTILHKSTIWFSLLIHFFHLGNFFSSWFFFTAFHFLIWSFCCFHYASISFISLNLCYYLLLSFFV